jgi:hypothetical protein
MSHELIDECSEKSVMVKIPLLVLSAWSEWAEVIKDETKVDPSRVKRSDERARSHSWHQDEIPTRPTTPTKGTNGIIKNYNGE